MPQQPGPFGILLSAAIRSHASILAFSSSYIRLFSSGDMTTPPNRRTAFRLAPGQFASPSAVSRSSAGLRDRRGGVQVVPQFIGGGFLSTWHIGATMVADGEHAMLAHGMVESERREILQGLKTGRDALRDALAGVDERLAMRKPSPGRWSILECVEHLAVSEQFLLSRLTKASRSDSSQGNRTRETAIVNRGLDRTRPVESPEVGRPNRRFQSLNEALSFFDSMRTEIIQFVEGFSDDPRFWVTDHPLIPGPVNCYEILLMISVHPVRHAKQIVEIRTALGH